MKTPDAVRGVGIVKWTRGMDALGEGFEAVSDWWDREGAAPCSYCRHYKPKGHLTEGNCGLCPLKTGEDCSAYWDEINVNDYDNELFIKACKKNIPLMLQQIMDDTQDTGE